MNRLPQLLQFLPVAIFLYFSKTQGWSTGFIAGGVAALVQFTLIFIKKIPLSRLLAGANLFLVIGALAFGFHITPIQEILGQLMEASIFVCVAIVLLITSLRSRTGAFEYSSASIEVTKRYSFALLLFTAICAGWALYFKGDTLKAGTLPFVALIIVKFALQKRLVSGQTPHSN
jgi:hypothetical protein